jgi:hypothetical protein
MMKYKLIKTYPGSPELGTVVEEKCKTSNFYIFNGNAVLRSHVEDNPEYWEKGNDNLWWVVFTKEDTIFESYYPYCLETSLFKTEDSRQYFKTKEEAEEFILHNSPCLSYNNIAWYLSSAQRDVVLNLIKKL